jgi:hypothetical protein
MVSLHNSLKLAYISIVQDYFLDLTRNAGAVGGIGPNNYTCSIMV